MVAKRVRRAALVSAVLLCAAGLSSVSVSSKTHRRLPRIVFLGDSITAGGIVGGKPPDSRTAFPAVIAEKLRQAGKNASVVNAGLPGETSSGALRRLDTILREAVDILVIELGCNDYSATPRASTNDNLREIIRRTKRAYPRVEIVLIRLAPQIGETRDSPSLTLLAREERVHFIQHFFRGVRRHGDLLQEDLFHPNAAGQKVLAANLWTVLEPLVLKL